MPRTTESMRSMVLTETMKTLAGRFSVTRIEVHGFNAQTIEIYCFYFPQ
jgi:hypothetical protein